MLQNNQSLAELKSYAGMGWPAALLQDFIRELYQYRPMNNLERWPRAKQRNRSLVTQPEQRLHKNASEKKRLSPFSKVEKPLLGAIDHSRMLPKNIPYDKESLYQEVLSLKMELNQTMDQNIRLKTRIVHLEKDIASGTLKAQPHDKQLFSKFKRDKHSHEGVLADGLKKIIKEIRRENEELKADNLKMKRNIKNSKTNELETEIATVIEHNQRLATTNQELQRKLQVLQAKNQTLQKSQGVMKSEMRQVQQQNTTLRSYIKVRQLEQKMEAASLLVKQRRARPAMKPIEEMKKELLLNKESSFRISKKEQLRAMRIQYNMLPVRRQPISIMPLQDHPAEKPEHEQTLFKKNQLLEQENKRLAKSCESLQEIVRKFEEKMQTQQQAKPKEQILVSTPKIQIEVKQEETIESQKKENRQASEVAAIEYSSMHNQQFNTKNQAEKAAKVEGPRAMSQPQSFMIKQKSIFKSSKKAIGDIRELLTYRMMAQRYSYNELKADIEQSSSKEFSYIDLCHMLVNEPFFLSVDHCRTLISFILEKEKPAHSDVVSSISLIAKLRRVIKDLECVPEGMEHKTIQTCVNVITEHSKHIKEATFYEKGESRTVRHDKLKELLSNLGLGEMETNLVISELSICSNDLTHLNLDVLFERFDLNELESSRNEHNVIEEAENDDSFINSKHKEEPKNEEKLESMPGGVQAEHISQLESSSRLNGSKKAEVLIQN